MRGAVDRDRAGKLVEPGAYVRAVGILVSAGQQIIGTIDELTLRETVYYAELVELGWTARQVVELRNLRK